MAIWKIETLQYLCFAERADLKKIWHGGVSRFSQPRQHIKFNNSTWCPIAIWKI